MATIRTENTVCVAPDGRVVLVDLVVDRVVVVAVLIANRAHSPSKQASVILHTVGPLIKVYV